MERIKILSRQQILLKLKRMAFEVWEENSTEEEIYVIGIPPGGCIIAQKMVEILKQIAPLKVHYIELDIDKQALTAQLPIEIETLRHKTVLIVDDVANSGKTLLYALKPILNTIPKKIQIAVLVDRKHKNYPIVPDIIGYSLSTTLQNHIIVEMNDGAIDGAFLE